MKRGVVAFVSGLVFATGLVLSGMTQPSKVLAFLDVSGAWDPSLAFVMLGAISISAIGFAIAARLARPAFDAEFHVPPRGPVRGDVLAGAAIFGLGWGLSGLCPGPAVVALTGGDVGALVFVAAMLAGGWGGSPSRDQCPTSSPSLRTSRRQREREGSLRSASAE